jgi:hypothetical protein
VLAIRVNLSKNGYPIRITEAHNLRFVLTITHEEGETYTQNYENIVPSEFGTFDMEFKVGTAISKITVTSYCTVFSKSENRERVLEFSSEKTFSSFGISPINLYLKESSEGYILYTLGKNGESKVK